MKNRQEFKKALLLIKRFYKEYVVPHRASYFSICLLHILYAGILIIPPFLIKVLIDNGVSGRNSSLVLQISIGIGIIYFLIAVISKIRSYWGHVISQKITYATRNNL